MRWRFVATTFFLVDGCAYSRSFCGFFEVAVGNMFSSVYKMMVTSLGEYVTVLNVCVLHGSSLHLALELGDFFSTNMSQRGIVTRLRCGEIFNYCFSRNLLLSLLMKNILIIG